MNAKAKNKETGSLVGKCSVGGVNENGQYLVVVYTERCLFLANTSFKHKLIHIYI